MKYILSFIIILFFFSGNISAQEANEPQLNWFDKFYQNINLKIIDPVKQEIQGIPEKAENSSQDILKQAQDIKDQKEAEIKQGIKQEIKIQIQKIIQKGINQIKSWLNPLKIKIQQGSNWIRDELEGIKEYLFNLF
ncbi:MAG: hypothetical protein ABIC36_00615 [bacterium]